MSFVQIKSFLKVIRYTGRHLLVVVEGNKSGPDGIYSCGPLFASNHVFLPIILWVYTIKLYIASK